ncbi:hypothetical protein OWM54_01795 [Myxococcus sp. MISCRS1]|uniref:hypothetical protein n=1 Tax=unclassified Myxococcus TaxID=2648731 RepID=UPI001CBB9B82|nr:MULTISPECIES: hypothetical protein [unclassified Myxococcus]MBZ4399362.1 hypothetical protein [Myxococcus sp. AS-1-15]MCY0995864.1 hypothetical protein [Myxococcus sp. MISCRS1]
MTSSSLLQKAALTAVVACGVACGEFDPESARTISQGVYGLTEYVDDVCSSSCDPEPRSMELSIRTQPDRELVTSVKSDGDGFYEAELASGDYVICTSFERCTDFSVESGQAVRLDYEMSVGPGWKK